MTAFISAAGKAASIPFHPFLFAAVLVLGPYLELMAHPGAVVRPLLAAIALSASVFAVASLVSRSVTVGALGATGLLLVLALKPITVAVLVLAASQPVVAALLVGATVAGLVVLGRIAWRRRFTAASATRWLNISSVLFLLIVILGAIPRGLPTALLQDFSRPDTLGAAQEGDPDIYLLLLDAYPGSETLRQVFGYDNDRFLEALEDRGLDVVEGSRSNYWFTSLTLGSVFHMRPLHEVGAFADVIEGRVAPQPTWRQAVNDAPAFDILRDRGYRVAAVAPGWVDVAVRSADEFIDGGQLSDFEVHLMRTAFIADLVELVDPDFFVSQQRQRIDSVFDAVIGLSISSGDGPRFTFAHVPAPHPPLAVTADGSTASWPGADEFYGITTGQMGISPDEFKNRFVEQLRYTNRRTLNAIDVIIENDEDAVIVVMSDHGPGDPGDPGDPEGIEVAARLRNLIAVRHPGRDSLLPDRSTLVNVLPRLFNAYFDLKLPYQADTSYRSTVFGTDEMFQALEPIPDSELDP